VSFPPFESALEIYTPKMGLSLEKSLIIFIERLFSDPIIPVSFYSSVDVTHSPDFYRKVLLLECLEMPIVQESLCPWLTGALGFLSYEEITNSVWLISFTLKWSILPSKRNSVTENFYNKMFC